MHVAAFFPYGNPYRRGHVSLLSPGQGRSWFPKGAPEPEGADTRYFMLHEWVKHVIVSLAPIEVHIISYMLFEKVSFVMMKTSPPNVGGLVYVS